LIAKLSFSGIKINADQMKVMTGGDKEETEEMKE